MLLNNFLKTLTLLTLVSGFEVFAENDFPFLQTIEENLDHPQNSVQILSSGIAALERRLQLIDEAKESISVESYIFRPDDRSVRLILQGLLKRASEGIKVRILADAGPGTWQLKTEHIDGLNQLCKKRPTCRPIEIRFYNHVPSAFFISSLNFRNHRKFFLVDDRVGITGGRNLADEYFDLDHVYNFLDRDVAITGPMIKTMSLAFDMFWNSSLTDKMEKHRDQKQKNYWTENVPIIANSFSVNDADKDLREKVKNLGEKVLASEPIGSCKRLTFVSDKSGWKRSDAMLGDADLTRKDMENARLVRKQLIEHAMKVRKSIIVSSTYLIETENSENALKSLSDRGVEITLMSNSLNSSDGFQVSAMLYDKFPDWLSRGISVYLHSGQMVEGTEVVEPEVGSSRWGTHAKTHLYDNDSFMIGSYNMDNRSSFYNTEAAVFCDGNEDLAAKLEESMERRINNSIQLFDKDTAVDSSGKKVSVYGNVNYSKILKLLLWTPVSKLIKPIL